MPTAPNADSTQYWCAEIDSERCAANIAERIKRYRTWLKETGRAQRMVRNWRTYYGYGPDGNGDTNQTSQSGEQGEYVDVTTNDFATLLTQTAVLTTADKPAFKAIATNADFDSMAQASFAQNLLEFYDKKHAVMDRDYEAVLTGLLSSQGWEIQGWDPTAGKSLTDFVEGQATNEGDISIHTTTPFRVAYDPDCVDVDKLQWLAFKTRYNRFDLAHNCEVKKPKVAEKLRAMSDNVSPDKDDIETDGFEANRQGSATKSCSSDLIWVWEFRHLPSPALPNGRLVRFVSSECVIYDSISHALDESGQPVIDESGAPQIQDSGYPYGNSLLADAYSPDVSIGGVGGHTAANDLTGLQECKDTIATQAASASNAGGISNLWTQDGDKPRVSAVIGAMNFVQSKTEPKPIKGIELSAQVPAFEQMVDRLMVRRMGQSDVSMGEVPKGMPGNLAALLEAKTVQYHSRGQASLTNMRAKRATGTLKLLQRFANTERVAVLGGKSNEWKYKQWSAKDISGVDRFVVEPVSPLTQTYAGKMDAAKDLLDHGIVKDGQQYLTLRETGRLEPLTDDVEANNMRIRKEKEMLQEGIGLPPVEPRESMLKGVPVFMEPPPGPDGKPGQCIRPLATDTHWSDINAYLGVAAMPMARDNPKLIAAVMGVVEEKLRLLKAMDPVMMAVRGCPPEIAQAVMQLRMPMMPPGMPPDVSGPPKPGATDSTKQPEQAGLPSGAPRIAAAKPPKNPLTGEQAPAPIPAGGIQ